MVDGWTIFYLLLTVLALVLAFGYGRGRADVREAATVCGLTFVVSNAAVIGGVPDGALYPLMDSFCAIVCFAIAWRRSHWWLVLVGALFVAMMGCHAVYFGIGDRSFEARYAYDLSLNVLYAAQLVTICSAATWHLPAYAHARHGVAKAIRRLLWLGLDVAFSVELGDEAVP